MFPAPLQDESCNSKSKKKVIVDQNVFCCHEIFFEIQTAQARLRLALQNLG